MEAHEELKVENCDISVTRSMSAHDVGYTDMECTSRVGSTQRCNQHSSQPNQQSLHNALYTPSYRYPVGVVL